MTAIRIETVADFLAHNHVLAIHCPRCGRWTAAPLQHLVTRGLGDRPIRNLRFRCAECGTEGTRQVRPPTPVHSNNRGWI